MIDSHTHLHLCQAPAAELIADAERAGVTRMVTVGTDSDSCRQALAAAEEFPQVYAAVGRHPNSATGFGDADLEELRELASHERCVAIGETGLDYYRKGATPDDQRRAFLAQIELARVTGKPLVIHTRDADDDTMELLEAHAGDLRVILHCFSMGSRVRECLAHQNWWLSFAGNSTYPKNAELMLAAVSTPGVAAAGRDRRPVPGAPAPPRQAQRAGQRRADRTGDRRRAPGRVRRARAHDRRRGRRRVRLVSVRSSRQRELGQNFLVDRNILDVIERLADAAAATTSCSRSAAAPGS